MRDVVVIGGGLCGLAAAWELEKRGVPYTLIEVKRRLGGSISSERRGGFALDSGNMLHTLADRGAFAAYAESLGLEMFEAGERVGLVNGTGALVDALAARLTAPRMMRMAVSTLGQTDAGTFLICMENGMVLDARTLIVAAPARFAERMFHTLIPEISYHLLDYRYDTITRVSLGYRLDEVGSIPAEPPADYPLVFIDHTAQAGRTLPGGVLVQVGVRHELLEGDVPDLVGQIAALFGWPLNPLVDHMAFWPEADPLMWRDERHPTTMTHIQHLLPPGAALCGSDYVPTTQPPRLDECIAQGQQAARRVMEALGIV